MRVLMVAAPGAGKGTQGERIAEHFGVRHIATGDLLRAHVKDRTALGKRVEAAMSRGELVSDDVVLEMVRSAMEEVRADDGGYVLDGMPRTLEQARALYAMGVELDLTADVALHLVVDEAELVRRLLERAHTQGRADDTEEVIRTRLALYNDVTAPILDYYAGRGILVTVDGARPVDAVTDQVLTALEVLRQTVARGSDAPRRPIDLTPLGAAFGVTPVEAP